MERNSIESIVINKLRYVMACFIVIMHAAVLLPISKYADAPFLQSDGVGDVLNSAFYIIICRLLTQVAVPSFFFISGYFYFNNFSVLKKETYFNKNKTRLKSLVVPYLTWNVLFLILYLIMGYANHKAFAQSFDEIGCWRFLIDCNNQEFTPNIIGFNMRTSAVPIDGPLWFVRDLILLSLISPLFLFFKGIPEKCLLILSMLLMVLNIFIPLPFISSIGFFFFWLGAYFKKNKLSIFSKSKKRKTIILISTIATFLLAFFSYGINIHLENATRNLFVISGTFFIFDIIYYFVSRSSWLQRHLNKDISIRSFFIYASHYNFVLLISSKLALLLTCNNILLSWMLTVIISLLIIELIFKVTRTFAPQIINILGGGQIMIESLYIKLKNSFVLYGC